MSGFKWLCRPYRQGWKHQGHRCFLRLCVPRYSEGVKHHFCGRTFCLNNVKNGASGTCPFKPLALRVGDPAKNILESISLTFYKPV